MLQPSYCNRFGLDKGFSITTEQSGRDRVLSRPGVSMSQQSIFVSRQSLALDRIFFYRDRVFLCRDSVWLRL